MKVYKLVRCTRAYSLMLLCSLFFLTIEPSAQAELLPPCSLVCKQALGEALEHGAMSLVEDAAKESTKISSQIYDLCDKKIDRHDCNDKIELKGENPYLSYSICLLESIWASCSEAYQDRWESN